MIKIEDGYAGDGARMHSIAIDFDGVIHPYSNGWADGSCYDPPAQDTITTLSLLLDWGYELVVFSCRPGDQIREYLNKHFADPRVKGLEVVREKPHAIIYIDDRGYRFVGDGERWSEIIRIFSPEMP